MYLHLLDMFFLHNREPQLLQEGGEGSTTQEEGGPVPFLPLPFHSVPYEHRTSPHLIVLLLVFSFPFSFFLPPFSAHVSSQLPFDLRPSTPAAPLLTVLPPLYLFTP